MGKRQRRARRSAQTTAAIPIATAWIGLFLLGVIVVDGGIYPLWLFAGGLVTGIAFTVDKVQARNGGWRIPERVLLGCMLAGGPLGGWFGMQIVRHKTLHRQFWIVLTIATVLHGALFVWSVAR